MRLDGRRESSNVEDRRGMSGGAKAGIGGIGAIVIAALFAWMSGGDPLSAGLQAAQEQMMTGQTETVGGAGFSLRLQENPGFYRGCLGTGLRADGRHLYTTHTRSFLKSGQLSLWICNCCCWTILLFR